VKESSVHYVRSVMAGYTFCGRYVSTTLDVTTERGSVTCSQCLREPGTRDRPAGQPGTPPAGEEDRNA
jgi:hypothetical protein